jgi:uncharacterized protein YjbI with pentapeptide repeats
MIEIDTNDPGRKPARSGVLRSIRINVVSSRAALLSSCAMSNLLRPALHGTCIGQNIRRWNRDAPMANDEHMAMFKQGLVAWNAWRHQNPDIRPDLSGSDLHDADLSEANLSKATLIGADLCSATLIGADLCGADFTRANLSNAILIEVDLRGANLSGANLYGANLFRASLNGLGFKPELVKEFAKILGDTDLEHSQPPTPTNLSGANLSRAYLSEANLCRADLSGANLIGADLTFVTLVNTTLTGADLTGCRIFGLSAWGLKLDGTKQENLIITDLNEPTVTVDNIEVAQFIYLMLNNQKLRDVIDTITSKTVLILGRFTEERKAVLDALREELRKHDYLPILFDFEKPVSRDTDETITLLARMARFVIADISDAKAVLQELRAIVPDLPSVPVQSIILATQEEPGMFDFYRSRPSFLTVHRYADQKQLLAEIGDKVIRPAELKVRELRG